MTVNYGVTGGTATGGGVDYTISGTQLTFDPGQTSKNVPITVVDDTLDEPDETIVVTLSSPINATLGANTAHTYTIRTTMRRRRCSLPRPAPAAPRPPRR